MPGSASIVSSTPTSVSARPSMHRPDQLDAPGVRVRTGRRFGSRSPWTTRTLRSIEFCSRTRASPRSRSSSSWCEDRPQQRSSPLAGSAPSAGLRSGREPNRALPVAIRSLVRRRSSDRSNEADRDDGLSVPEAPPRGPSAFAARRQRDLRGRRTGRLSRFASGDARDPAPAPRGDGMIGLYRPEEHEVQSLASEFQLHPLAVEDAINAHQRPKLERHDDTLFVVLGPPATWTISRRSNSARSTCSSVLASS